MKNIVLFGAGVYAKKYKSLLDFLGIEFHFFTDNDKSKIGTELYGRKVISPETLRDLDCNIIISCTHGEQIEKQLTEMGILDKLLKMEDFYEEFAHRIREIEVSAAKALKQKRIIVDMYEGIGWGGTEVWASNVAAGLSAQGYEVALFGSAEQAVMEDNVEKITERFQGEKVIEHMVEYMLKSIPFTLINNFAGCAFLAAVMVKMQYPEQVKIINVIHNDSKSLFQAHMVFRECVDSFICVSNKIRNTIVEEYGIDSRKVFFKEQPIETDGQLYRGYSVKGSPLRIGYAARLVNQQKRADLIPELVERLEVLQINYVMEIAGEGECVPAIKAFVKERGMEQKVILHGRLPKGKMPDFWKVQDIYLNFSEYEGTSLSMLEAMSFACVPVVTDVSGVSEFIVDDVNGYVCEIGDLDGIAERLQRLDNTREKLAVFGERCRREIVERCNPKEYIGYIGQIIEECWNG